MAGVAPPAAGAIRDARTRPRHPAKAEAEGAARPGDNAIRSGEAAPQFTLQARLISWKAALKPRSEKVSRVAPPPEALAVTTSSMPRIMAFTISRSLPS